MARLILGSYIFAVVWLLVRLPEIMTIQVVSGIPTYEAITFMIGYTAIVGPTVGYLVGVTR